MSPHRTPMVLLLDPVGSLMAYRECFFNRNLNWLEEILLIYFKKFFKNFPGTSPPDPLLYYKIYYLFRFYLPILQIFPEGNPQLTKVNYKILDSNFYFVNSQLIIYRTSILLSVKFCLRHKNLYYWFLSPHANHFCGSWNENGWTPLH